MPLSSSIPLTLCNILPALQCDVRTWDHARWTRARRRAWGKRLVNPDAYFYHYLHPSLHDEVPRSWSVDQHALFLAALQEVSLKHRENWGIFSLLVPGKIGSECKRYFNAIGRAGFISFNGTVKKRLICRASVKNDDDTGKIVSANPVFLRRCLRKFIPKALPKPEQSLLRGDVPEMLALSQKESKKSRAIVNTIKTKDCLRNNRKSESGKRQKPNLPRQSTTSPTANHDPRLEVQHKKPSKKVVASIAKQDISEHVPKSLDNVLDHSPYRSPEPPAREGNRKQFQQIYPFDDAVVRRIPLPRLPANSPSCLETQRIPRKPVANVSNAGVSTAGERKPASTDKSQERSESEQRRSIVSIKNCNGDEELVVPEGYHHVRESPDQVARMSKHLEATRPSQFSKELSADERSRKMRTEQQKKYSGNQCFGKGLKRQLTQMESTPAVIGLLAEERCKHGEPLSNMSGTDSKRTKRVPRSKCDFRNSLEKSVRFSEHVETIHSGVAARITNEKKVSPRRISSQVDEETWPRRHNGLETNEFVEEEFNGDSFDMLELEFESDNEADVEPALNHARDEVPMLCGGSKKRISAPNEKTRALFRMRLMEENEKQPEKQTNTVNIPKAALYRSTETAASKGGTQSPYRVTDEVAYPAETEAIQKRQAEDRMNNTRILFNLFTSMTDNNGKRLRHDVERTRLLNQYNEQMRQLNYLHAAQSDIWRKREAITDLFLEKQKEMQDRQAHEINALQSVANKMLLQSVE